MSRFLADEAIISLFGKRDKSARGNASQFFVAGELCRRGYLAVVTMGNAPNTDILCGNLEGTDFVHIQVKTFVPGNRTCSVSKKAEQPYGPNFFWVLGGIPAPGSEKAFEYYIIPSDVMAANVKDAHSKWLSVAGAKGQERNDSNVRIVHLPPYRSCAVWDITPFRERWDLIDERLKPKVSTP